MQQITIDKYTICSTTYYIYTISLFFQNKMYIAFVSRVLEMVGYSISLIVLTFALITFCYFRYNQILFAEPKGIRLQLHLHYSKRNLHHFCKLQSNLYKTFAAGCNDEILSNPYMLPTKN